jgi:hypothetical protein
MRFELCTNLKARNTLSIAKAAIALGRFFLESVVFADKTETALRCYLITHQHFASVSDLDEYQALRAEQQRTVNERLVGITANLEFDNSRRSSYTESERTHCWDLKCKRISRTTQLRIC